MTPDDQKIRAAETTDDCVSSKAFLWGLLSTREPVLKCQGLECLARSGRNLVSPGPAQLSQLQGFLSCDCMYSYLSQACTEKHAPLKSWRESGFQNLHAKLVGCSGPRLRDKSSDHMLPKTGLGLALFLPTACKSPLGKLICLLSKLLDLSSRLQVLLGLQTLEISVCFLDFLRQFLSLGLACIYGAPQVFYLSFSYLLRPAALSSLWQVFVTKLSLGGNE